MDVRLGRTRESLHATVQPDEGQRTEAFSTPVLAGDKCQCAGLRHGVLRHARVGAVCSGTVHLFENRHGGAAHFETIQAQIDALGITPRELEVLHLIAEGLSTREMAERLFVSENTVKTHTSRVLDKLGASRRTQAVQLAKQQGIIA